MLLYIEGEECARKGLFLLFFFFFSHVNN